MDEKYKVKLNKFLWFCCGFFSMIAIIICVYFFEVFVVKGYLPGVFTLIFGTSSLAILGLILWAVIRKKKRMLALGFLIGGLAPGVYLLIITGGCGLLL